MIKRDIILTWQGAWFTAAPSAGKNSLNDKVSLSYNRKLPQAATPIHPNSAEAEGQELNTPGTGGANP